MTRRFPDVAATTAASSAAAHKTDEVPKVGDVLTLECTSLAFGGRGVCKLPGGFVIFCDRALPVSQTILLAILWRHAPHGAHHCPNDFH